MGLTLRGGVRGDRKGQLGQVADALGEAGVIERDVVFFGEGDEPGGDDEHAAVPFAESLAEEFDAAGLFEEPLRFTQRFVFRISGAFHVLERSASSRSVKKFGPSRSRFHSPLKTTRRTPSELSARNAPPSEADALLFVIGSAAIVRRACG